jgi:ABC-type transport system involved in multi-copper enzyme maturation permease subunit
VNVDTLGGFLSWHYGAYLSLIAGLWSILALSSTLAGEARRGSLDLTAATPHSMRSIALGKVAAHVVALTAVCALVAVAAWLTGLAFARLPGDGITIASAAAWAAGVGAKALIAGSIAFSLSTVLGRGAAAGLAGGIMVAGYVLQGYRAVVPAFDAAAPATWFSWTANHLPLAGQTDWIPIAITAAAALLLLVIGVDVFARRDIGVTIRLPGPRLPGWLVGVRGPVRRSFGDLLPGAAWWGIGLAVYGFVMAAASRSLTEAIVAAPDLATAVRALIPGIDLTTAAGFLQLAFADLGFVLVGIAVATFVARRSSDESAGRLELQLASPLTPWHWALSSAVAVGLAIGLVAVLLAAAIATGVASSGQDPWQPTSGVIVLAIYGLGLTGIGVAVAGLFGAGVSASTVLVVAIGTFLIDLLAPALQLPAWVEQMALTHHLGSPMIGVWDGFGVAACLVLALGGALTGAWAMSRRDLSG